MFRLRRYRIFIVFAVFALGTLYHFTTFRDLESAGAASVEGLKNFGHKGTGSIPQAPEAPILEIQNISTDDDQDVLSSSPTLLATLTAPALSLPSIPTTTSSSALVQTVEEKPTSSAPSSAIDQDIQKPLDDQSEQLGELKTVTPTTAEFVPHDQSESKLDGVSDVRETSIHWTKLQDHFPVPSQSIIPLPTGKPKAIPKIQHIFSDESANDRFDRLQKLNTIKVVFMTSWTGYKDHAWMEDELSPVSGSSRNPFCGWAATLVDSLDTLWIMGLKEEFEEATNAIKNIDFTTSNRQQIPLFETVIRYLGGLISAYDLSSGTYRVLLDKAVELAEVLMGAFDTPNRMPMTFFSWKPTFASQPHRAQTRVVLAELGSLSVEFTRLAQITRESKYYDAIARITQELEIWQNNTKLPGLWPMVVDASGCKKADETTISPVEHSLLNGPGIEIPKTGGAISSDNDTVTGESSDSDSHVKGDASTSKSTDSKISVVQDTPNVDDSKSKVGTVKRQLLDEAINSAAASPLSGLYDLPDCEPQGLASPPGSIDEDFTLGGQADSTYEYLPKQYMLLGGLEDAYRSMYEMALETTKKYLLFRPMLPDDRNVLLSGIVRTSGRSKDPKNVVRKPEGTHLTCFVGGMVAVGSRIFNRESDLDIARKLTDGCVWAYEATTTGIMPEQYLAAPCKNKVNCPWNETRYHELLDPYRESRERQRIEQEERFLQAQKEADDRAAQKTQQAEEVEAFATTQADIPEESEKADKIEAAATSQEDTKGLNEAEAVVTAQADSPKESKGANKLKAIATSGADFPKESEKAEKVEKVGKTEKAAALPVTEEEIPKVSEKPPSKASSIKKRQLGSIENEQPLNKATQPLETLKENLPKPKESDGNENIKKKQGEQSVKARLKANSTVSELDESESAEYVYIPPPILTSEEFVKARIKDEKLPPGITRVVSPRYILRPEAIESVFIMYRITGESYWREKGWKMFEAINKYTAAKYGASAIDDVTSEKPMQLDEMESFWLAETLKYFFLLFSDPDTISLDDYVLNTEAHPFKRPK